MKAKTALKIILGVAILGILFSGYLSYTELFQKTCALGTCASVSGIPVCVYGLIMYLIVFAVALLGLRNK